MTNGYLEVISLVERLHRHFLEVVKLELDGLGIHDINNVQGMMLFNIGDAEMTVGELTLRGCYLGSNVSYNVKKMVENGYLVQERSVHDRRSIHVRLTDKGRTLRDRLSGMHRRHIEMLAQTDDHRGRSAGRRRRPCAGSSGSGSAPATWCSGRDNSPPDLSYRPIFQVTRRRRAARSSREISQEPPHALASASRRARSRAERRRRARTAAISTRSPHRACARSSTTAPMTKTRASSRRRGAPSRRGARHCLSPHPGHRRDLDRAPMSRLLPRCCARRRSRSSRIAAAAPARPCSGP